MDEPILPAPIPYPRRPPVEYITTEGPVKWIVAPKHSRQRCEDCMHEIWDHVRGAAPEGRSPGLANLVRHKRVQGGQSVLLCSEHKLLRQERGE